MTPLLAIALLAAPAYTSSVSLDVGAAADVYNGQTLWSMGAGASAVFYQQPLVDDGTPYSLQPFLQRESTLSLAAGLGYRSAPAGGASVSTQSGALGIDRYLSDWLIFSLSGSVERGALNDAPNSGHTPVSWLVPSFSVGPGYRTGDTRIDLTWQFATYVVDFAGGTGDSDSRGLGRLRLSAFTVLDKTLSLSAAASTLPGGAELGASGTFHPLPVWDLGAGVRFASGELSFVSTAVIQELRGHAEASRWFSPGVKATLGVSITRSFLPASAHETVSELHAGISARF